MRLFLTIILFLYLSNVYCQVNLVPNSGFDSIISCPTNAAQIYKAPPWTDPNSGSSDLYNICSGNNLTSIPSNSTGWQNPFNGSGYAGVVTYVDNPCCPDHREYVQVQLTSSLIAGRTYCVSFRISWADSVRCAADGIGAYFSPSPVSCSGCFLPFVAQVNNLNGNILADPSQWEIIQGTFVAQGGEQYITLGNFKPDSLTNFQIMNVNATSIVAYYYIDDVSVSEVEPVLTGTTYSICSGDSVQIGTNPNQGVNYTWQPSGGLSDSITSNPVASPTATTTYTLTQTQCDVIQTATVTITIKTDCETPPPIIPSLLAHDQMLSIQNLEDNSRLEVFDIRGRRVFLSENYHNEFGGFMVAAGTYVLQLTRPGGEKVMKKLIVVR